MQTWFTTYTGVHFDPFDPKIDNIRIEDIAHSLAHQCRFAGHCREFYSVAQHSVIVSANVPPAWMARALLHDASEAYLSDVIRPVKHRPEMKFYRDAEAALQTMICLKFGIDPEEPDCVKDADTRALRTEMRDLTISVPPAMEVVEPLDIRILAWGATYAEQQFLAEFLRLFPAHARRIVRRAM